MMALEARRRALAGLLKRAKSDTLRFSESFDDPLAPLAACDKHGLEGIVSKLRNDRYRSGKNRGWIKVKTATWREANRDRFEMFERS
jgi:bifunctional non-homologous end joining protein LigD